MIAKLIGPVTGTTLALLLTSVPLQAAVVFETTSPYHHIRVVDESDGSRMLSFDTTRESRVFVRDPLTGHFQYTEFFHMPWLWNLEIKTALLIGLGGASTHRAFQHYYPDTKIDAVELDAAVVKVAKDYFFLEESPTLKVHVEDGRVFLRRSKEVYDLIVLDAYSSGRYGSSLPYHLVTKEFFKSASDHLSPNGVLAYNVIGTVADWKADIVSAVYATMTNVFPQAYLFTATESLNVVLIATKTPEKFNYTKLNDQVSVLTQRRSPALALYRSGLRQFRGVPPPAAATSPVLTDDFAPIDGLLNTVPKR